MLKRVVYISGPSGTGKTTIINQLLQNHPDLFIAGNPEKLDRANHTRYKNKIFPSIYDYATDKINQRFNDAKNHQQLSEENPNAIILGDRCIHDTISYINAAVQYGDLTKEEADKLFDYQKIVHLDSFMPKHVVFIDNPLSEIMKYLSLRSTIEGKSFREEDPKYLALVSDCFREHFSTINDHLYLETPKDAMQKIDAWIIQRIKR